MVIVEIQRNHECIRLIKVSGHAEYAEHGKDLVCAGVSSIMIGGMNALHSLVPNQCQLIMREAYIEILSIENTQCVNIILQTILLQLQTLQESYSGYIRIKDQEV